MGIPAAFAATTATTDLNVTFTAGALSITSDASTALKVGGVNPTVSTTTDQTGTATTNIDYSDTRGSGAGYTVSVTSQHLTHTDTPATTAGATVITLSAGSRFDGTTTPTTLGTDPHCKYTVTITTAGTAGGGVAKYSTTISGTGCADGGLQVNVALATADNLVGSKGVKFDAAGAYVLDDAFQIAVDTFPYTSNTITCAAPTATTGSTTGMATPGCAAFTGAGATSAAQTVETAPVNTGMGSYDQNVSHSYVLHKNSFSGAYSGNLVFTIV